MTPETVELIMRFAVGLNLFASAAFAAQSKMNRAYYHLIVSLILAFLQWGNK
jgi:hypothetical protein